MLFTGSFNLEILLTDEIICLILSSFSSNLFIMFSLNPFLTAFDISFLFSIRIFDIFFLSKCENSIKTLFFVFSSIESLNAFCAFKPNFNNSLFITLPPCRLYVLPLTLRHILKCL